MSGILIEDLRSAFGVSPTLGHDQCPNNGPHSPVHSAKARSTFIKDFAAGGISAALAKSFTAPIERVKIVIQTQDNNPKIKSGEVSRYTGIVNCVTRIYSEQGLRSFWAGNFANIVRYFPTQAFNLAFKDKINALFPKYDRKKEFFKFGGIKVLSGGSAAGLTLVIVYPLDYTRTRLASDVGSGKKQFSGIWDCISKTSSGPKGPIALYNGFAPSVVGIMVYRGAQFGLFDTITAFNPLAKEVGPVAIVSKFISAQTAVVISGLISYPLDTVRRRLQMESDRPMEQRMYRGTMHAITTIIANEGVSGMYKGALINVFRGLGSSLTLLMYGEIKNMMERNSKNDA